MTLLLARTVEQDGDVGDCVWCSMQNARDVIVTSVNSLRNRPSGTEY